MGNVFITFQAPQIDTTPHVECPTCYLSCRTFKKLHRNPQNQPPHFACIPCRNQLFYYLEKPNCPICVTPIYTLSNCHYFQCDSWQQIKKYKLAHSHFQNVHPNEFICCDCLPFDITKCPLCKEAIDSKILGKNTLQINNPVVENFFLHYLSSI